MSDGDDAGARAVMAPQIAEEILRRPGNPRSSERAALVDPILRQGLVDARSVGNTIAIVSIVGLLLQFCDVPAGEGEALIDEALDGVQSASVGQARTLLIVSAEFLHHAAVASPLAERERLLRRGLALLQPLLEGSFGAELDYQHRALAARLRNELGEPRDAEALLMQALTLAALGTHEWVNAAIELGLTLNDVEEHQRAVDVLVAALPFARDTLVQNRSTAHPHRGFDISDVASALAESLAALRLADDAFAVIGLAFVDVDGHSDPCDLGAMCAQLDEDELGVMFCVNNATTMFLFDREEALRVRVISGASVQVWLQMFETTGWLRSAFTTGRSDAVAAAVDQLNQSLHQALGGLQAELGAYKSLMVIPHRSICMLPFWLLEACADVAVRIVPSPSLLHEDAHDGRPRDHFLSVADPNGDLLSARVESEALCHRVGSALEFERLTKSECTVDRMLALLPRAAVWHFAGHAASDLVDPDNSRLQLHAGPGGGNSYLDSAALRKLDLHGCRLVILSACSSGVPELRIDGVTRLAGLPTLLLTRGAATVVASLWEIGDDSTALVVDQLFAELLDGDGPKDVPAALKRAVEHVRSMSPPAVAARFEEIAASSPDAPVAAAARSAAQHHGAARVRAPFGAVDQWGAFFTVGARFIELGKPSGSR